MGTNIEKLLARTRPETAALLRTQRFYSTRDMIQQYKTHILCHLECNSGGFYHAVDTVLGQLDNLQAHFLRNINISVDEAFLVHNLAPLSTRRDIAMLGLIFKSVHGTAHEDLQSLFPRQFGPAHSCGTRLQIQRHQLQLEEDRPGTHHALLRRSVFGLTRIWNRLPAQVVQAKSVTDMQRALTALVRAACRRNDGGWADIFSPRPAILRDHTFFDELLKAGCD